MTDVKTKICTKCGEEKEDTIIFFPWRKDANKLHTQCRICLRRQARDNKRKRTGYVELAEQVVKYTESGIKLKICIDCGQEKEETKEFFQWRKDQNKFTNQCKVCRANNNKKYRENNEEKCKEYKRNYRKENKQEILESDKIYREENKEKEHRRHKKYYEEHKEAVNKKVSNRIKNKMKTDPIFRCMVSISKAISFMLKHQGGIKKGISSKSKVPFTGEELWAHLEKQFSDPENLTPDGEIWMTRFNRGTYNQNTWDDNNPSTWKWQIDHIIPQSKLKFDSYDHPNFLICWDLSNLRPLSAKKNIKEGNRRY